MSHGAPKCAFRTLWQLCQIEVHEIMRVWQLCLLGVAYISLMQIGCGSHKCCIGCDLHNPIPRHCTTFGRREHRKPACANNWRPLRRTWGKWRPPWRRHRENMNDNIFGAGLFRHPFSWAPTLGPLQVCWHPRMPLRVKVCTIGCHNVKY